MGNHFSIYFLIIFPIPPPPPHRPCRKSNLICGPLQETHFFFFFWRMLTPCRTTHIAYVHIRTHTRTHFYLLFEIVVSCWGGCLIKLLINLRFTVESRSLRPLSSSEECKVWVKIHCGCRVGGLTAPWWAGDVYSVCVSEGCHSIECVLCVHPHHVYIPAGDISLYERVCGEGGGGQTF